MYVRICICIINLAHAQCMHLSTCLSTTRLVFLQSRRIIRNKCFDPIRIFSGGEKIKLIRCKIIAFSFTLRGEKINFSHCKKMISYFAPKMMAVMK